MQNPIFSRITTFKRRNSFLFWLIVATIIVYILGAVYVPWEWGSISESDTLNNILYSGIGEMFWIMHDVSAFAQVHQNIDTAYTLIFVFALFSWLVFIKNIVLGHFGGDDESHGFGKAVQDYLFDIIFSYVSALVCYAMVPVFLALNNFEPGSMVWWVIFGVAGIALCFFPSVVAFARLGLIMGIIYVFSDKFVELVEHIHISVFPLNILSSFLSGAVIFLIGFLLDALCTYLIRLIIKMCERFFEKGRLLEILYQMT